MNTKSDYNKRLTDLKKEISAQEEKTFALPKLSDEFKKEYEKLNRLRIRRDGIKSRLYAATDTNYILEKATNL